MNIKELKTDQHIFIYFQLLDVVNEYVCKEIYDDHIVTDNKYSFDIKTIEEQCAETYDKCLCLRYLIKYKETSDLITKHKNMLDGYTSQLEELKNEHKLLIEKYPEEFI